MSLRTLLDDFDRAEREKVWHGYGPRGIPSPEDGRLGKLVRVLRFASEAEQREALVRLSALQRDVLVAWAERAAALAIRRRDPSLAESAAAALGLVSIDHADRREVLLVMPLPWHAAEVLGAVAAGVFECGTRPARRSRRGPARTRSARACRSVAPSRTARSAASRLPTARGLAACAAARRPAPGAARRVRGHDTRSCPPVAGESYGFFLG